jgi:integral membrane protein
MLTSTLGRLRFVGLLEGFSFIILLCIAMPLKYYAGMPSMVRVVGMGHGILFIAYITLALYAKVLYQWPIKKLLLLWVASVVPLGTFYVDYKILKYEMK